jgi:hypothetical protein
MASDMGAIMKTGRNDLCTCGSGLKFKKCCEPKQAQTKLENKSREVIPSVYQPIAAHGYGPHQFEEMIRYAQQMRSTR